MHAPEAPAEAPRTLRDFLRAYMMIVLSILTALALERAVIAWNDAAAAAAARGRIEQELAVNRHEIETAIAANQHGIQAGAVALNTIVALLKAPHPDESALRRAVAEAFAHGVGLDLPTWRQNAWDAAIADQSASHLRPVDLRRYAEIYATARDVLPLENAVASGAVLAEVAQLQLSIQLGQTDGRQAALLLLRYRLMAQQLVESQKALRDIMSDAARTPAPAGAPR